MKCSMKTVVAVILLFSATLSANAQFNRNRVPDRFHFGIRAGITSNVYTGDVHDVEALIAPTGGFAFDVQVAPVPVFIGFGFNYFNEGVKMERGSYSKSEDIHALHIPLVASYHINVAPNLFINPFFGGFTAIKFGKKVGLWDDNKVNIGLRAGCGLNFGRLTFDVGYDFGLTNAYDYDKIKVHSGTFFATLGVNFAGSR